MTDYERGVEQASNIYREVIREYVAENVKLVEVLHEVEAEAVHAYRCLQKDCVTTANSSQHFFDKWWHTECELDRLKIENTDLRELLSMYVTFARTVARGLCIQSAYADGMGRELNEAEMRERAMELGIEADE